MGVGEVGECSLSLFGGITISTSSIVFSAI